MAVLMALVVILTLVFIAIVAAVAAFAMVVMLIALAAIFLVVSYVLDAYAKYKLFKLFGVDSPYCAFIPFYSNYLLGHMCTGRDGYFYGPFGMSVPNLIMELGWLYMFMNCFGIVNMQVISFVSRERAEMMFAGAIFFLGILYWSNIWAFVFSRLEGRSVEAVTGIAVLSSIIGIVAIVKVISLDAHQVYSLENDVYPLEYDDTEE